MSHPRHPAGSRSAARGATGTARARRHMLAIAAAAAATLGALGMPVAAWAQAVVYPSKPIRLIVPFAAGAATDIGARNLATRLADVLGQPIVVDNRPGGGGNLATRLTIQAPADGYTLLAAGTGLISNVFLYGDPGYEPFRDIVAIAPTTKAASMLIVRDDAPWKTAQEFVAALRGNTLKPAYGSGGIGTSAHMAGSAFLKLAGAEGVHVPYKSAAEIVQSVLGGQVVFGVPILAVAVGPAKAGRLRPLAVSTPERHPQFPEVPTFAEALGKPFALTTWFGIAARAGTPEPIVRQLHTAILKVQAMPSFREATARDGSLVFTLDSPQAFTAFLREEEKIYRTLVAETGAKAE